MLLIMDKPVLFELAIDTDLSAVVLIYGGVVI